MLDVYGNHVEEGLEVQFQLDGFSIPGLIGSKHKVDNLGRIDLGGLLKVTAGYGKQGGSLFGYDLGVSGGVTSMDDFLKEFFPKIYRRKQAHLHETDDCKNDIQLLTLFTSSLYYLEPLMLLETKGVEPASLLVQSASS
ncbi:hypothetical protein V6Z11_D01G174100 [Gossypium hirsutum]|uniref:Sugar transport protein 11 isoform X1 n=1 Tax=Gossypium hirsutum TaxID=3635 RepID=A0A1U8KYZ7_GOSHI|nr:sugar transport protein 11 isoform X1 [Gossypium hirsutum]XP_016707617.1 sugar transport protein 11 isoform X1 [Gossypium hirsutum]XP_016707619.1 sugar transport protein 11 isoform X1 [Gossypium hirsutum]XP_040942473.1 sugar transport protein 11 isoform X1 [Gossypium hirsutum]